MLIIRVEVPFKAFNFQNSGIDGPIPTLCNQNSGILLILTLHQTFICCVKKVEKIFSLYVSGYRFFALLIISNTCMRALQNRSKYFVKKREMFAINEMDLKLNQVNFFVSADNCRNSAKPCTHLHAFFKKVYLRDLSKYTVL